ncbi:MAG: MaoC family dehydratase N-terminal domain-containing protein [Lautropia sp.]
MTAAQTDYASYIGRRGEPKVSTAPLERDTLRRFVQAIMDRDPLYYDDAHAAATAFGTLVAPPLYPVHAFRTAAGAPDPLDAVQADPDADGSAGNDGMFFGLEPIASPFKRLLNGGNEIEFFRCLALGERCVAQARYANVVLKEGKSGPMLLVDIETTFRTEAGELLLINRQTLIWR